jgi:methionyl aminopeptidase
MNSYSEKFEKMRVAGSIAAKTLDMLTENIKEGISTDYIDKLGYEFIRDNGGHSAPLYYRGFKKSLCTSLNHVVCHGIPSQDRILKEGDAVNIDVTAIVDEHYGDTSRMFCVGKIPVKLNNLINATYESMMRAIKILKPGIKLGDIGHEIQSYVEEKGFSVVRDFCGHGISTTFHEPPNILHYGNKNSGMTLVPGMTFTIEPMINEGKFPIKMLNDGWTAVTKDKSLSAQFEHTLGITEDGYEIFTKSAKGYLKPPYITNI